MGRTEFSSNLSERTRPFTGDQTDDVRYALRVLTHTDMSWQSSRDADLEDVDKHTERITYKTVVVMLGGVPIALEAMGEGGGTRYSIELDKTAVV